MRIVVNDIAASSGGALTILESFYRYVRDFGADHEWVFLLGSDLLEETDNIRTILLPEVKRRWLRRLAFDLVSGRRLIRSLTPDAICSLQNTYTYGLACPQVVYVHQSLPFQKAKTFSLWRRDERFLAIYQHVIGLVIRQSARHADHVIVQAEWMGDAIQQQVGVASHRIHTIPPDLDDVSDYAFDGTLDAGAFFYPTSAHSYKNNDCIFAASKLLREQGVDDFMVTMTVGGPVTDANVAPIGRVPRSQVLTALSRTTLIFPSLIESSPLPLGEARALGALVLAADLPYAREVLRGYENAYYFDPASPQQLAALMGRVIAGNITRSPLARPTAEPDPEASTSGWARVVEVLRRCAREGRRAG